MVKLHGE